MYLIYAYFYRMGRSPLLHALDSHLTPVCPRSSGESSNGAFAEYSATVRNSLDKHLSSRMNELLANIERRTQWNIDLKDDGVEYLDIKSLAGEHWNTASSDANNRDVEIDQIDTEDIIYRKCDFIIIVEIWMNRKGAIRKS